MPENAYGELGLEDEVQLEGFPLDTAHPNGADGLGLPGGEDLELESEPESDFEPPLSSWDGDLDDEEEEKAYRETQPPGGYYMITNFSDATEITKEVDYFVKVDDGYQKVSRPRTITTYGGRGFLVDKNGKEWTPRLRVRVSPERAYAKDRDGQVVPDKFDSATKLFQHARLAYKEVLGEPAKTKRQIDEFLRAFPFRIQTMQLSDGSLLVLGLQGVKPA